MPVTKSSVNPILILLLAVLLGGIAGYVFSSGGKIAATSNTATAPCPHELGPADEYIIAGFTCPSPACQDGLIECHCEVAHNIKDKVMQELAQGKDGTMIRNDLIQQYGADLKKTT